MVQQECIPVGCVPAARRPYAGVCLPGGVSIPGGWFSIPGGWFSIPGGVFSIRWGGSPSGGVSIRGALHLGGLSIRGVLHLGGLSIPGGVFSIRWGGSPSGGSPSRGGGSPSGGVLHPGGLSIPGGYGTPACTEADTLPPCGQTHTCKNITLATTSLRPVKTPTCV